LNAKLKTKSTDDIAAGTYILSYEYDLNLTPLAAMVGAARG
jgi:hypothetical protein